MVKLRDRILLSPLTKYFASFFIVAALFLSSVYIIMILVLDNVDDNWPTTCNIKPNYQVECLPGRTSDYRTCSMVGCCWSDETSNCYHSLPPKHGYYRDDDTNTDIYQGVHLSPRREYSPLGSKSLTSLYFHVTLVDSEYLQLNLKRAKPKKQMNNATKSLINSGFTVLINSPAFSITVLRHRPNSTKIHLLNTALGPLIVTNTYWEWTIYMSNITLYGLESAYIRESTNWLYNNAEHSEIPAFFGITLEGEAFAWYVPYSGPMEIQVLGNSNLVVLKGMSLPEEISLRVFAGSTPQQTIKRLYKSLEDDGYIMKKNSTIPVEIVAASLGLHVCPDLVFSDESAEDSLNKTIADTEKLQVPWDTHCVHRRFHFTLDTILNETEIKLLIQLKNILKNVEKLLVPHLTPMLLANNHILLSELENSSLVLKNSSQIYLGSYHGTSVVYPEWSDNRIYEVLQNCVINYTESFATSKLVIIRDAWPKDDTNACTHNFTQFDYMPQELGRLMLNGTIPYDLTSTGVSSHYTTHNAYANKFRAFIHQNAYPLPSKEVLPYETDENADKFGWSTLRETINRGIGSGLVGQLPPIIYVCNSHTSPYMTNELCIRWYGAAVVFPFVMAIPEYLPGGSSLTVGSSKYAKAFLELRTKFITYQYTVMEEHFNSGQPVLAPVQFHYPLESLINQTNNVDQFIWGSSLLIGIVTLPNTRQLQMRIPGDLPWRHLGDGVKVSPSSGTKTVSIPVTEGQIVILVRPGHIIPMHENVSMTSAKTIRSAIELVVNLACYEQNNCVAQGKIAYGSEIFLNIVMNETVLTFMNILNVKSHACTTTIHNTILMKYLTILGDQFRYRLPINFNICNNTGDVVDDTHDIILGKQ